MVNRTGMYRFFMAITGLVAMSVVLADCGGGGGGTVGGMYSISGTVTGAVVQGVTMTLSGAGSGAVLTDGSGNYSLTGLANGGYTVTPAKSGYTFSPTARTTTISDADSTGIDFIALAAVQDVEIVACASVTADATVAAVGFSGFNPASVTINVNQVVKWSNTTGFNHTVTSDTGEWTSATLNNNTSVCLRFNVAGTYAYHCSPHPSMTGSVTVQ